MSSNLTSRLIDARRRLGLSQDQMAVRLQSDPDAYRRWEMTTPPAVAVVAAEAIIQARGGHIMTGKQRKEADRLPGIEIMLPWPSYLPPPCDLTEDEERDATKPERDAAHWILGDLAAIDLTVLRVSVAMIRRPSTVLGERQVLPHLAPVVIHTRWLAAHDRPEPKTMWAIERIR